MKKRNQVRLVMLFPTIMLGGFIFSFFHICWTDFWLTQDAARTTAIITGEKSHGVVAYKYTVGGNEFVGQSQRSRDESQKTAVGGQAPVYVSSSRPWLSSLEVPAFPPSGTPVVVIALLIEVLFVLTVVNPKGKWALRTGLKPND